MLHRALKYKNEISRFLATAFQSELALTATEWISIEIITQWLWLCHQATEQTSATKQVTLSMTHGIFHSLQDHLRRAVANLPVGVPFQLRSALIAAHLKLSEYYAHFDESPFYLWACFLDPRIGYEGLKHQASQEDSYRREDYLKEINDAVESFKQYYLDHYAPPLTTAADGTNTSKPFDFFAIYALSPTTPTPLMNWSSTYLCAPKVSPREHVNLSSGGSATSVFIPTLQDLHEISWHSWIGCDC
ncbi:hypothetical protein BJV78DRAFT_21441 [Lactifluus subvellereus]|nr:hypothetical protein BJV78DRAFT_21441 [Lactifluus subvellereus]